MRANAQGSKYEDTDTRSFHRHRILVPEAKAMSLLQCHISVSPHSIPLLALPTCIFLECHPSVYEKSIGRMGLDE